jgi:RNA polymerase sigma-70 factor (ECF subfamily)
MNGFRDSAMVPYVAGSAGEDGPPPEDSPLRPIVDPLSQPDDEPESAYLARLVARDERAFSKLVRLYERRIYVLVCRMIGKPEDAKEITQEVFIRVFKHIHEFRGDSKLSTWIYRIAINVTKNRMAYSRVRKESKQREYEEIQERLDGGTQAGVVVASIPRPDEATSSRQMIGIVQAAMARIDVVYREALILRDVEELSYEEIAVILEINEGTVKSRIFRARGILKEILEKELGPNGGLRGDVPEKRK